MQIFIRQKYKEKIKKIGGKKQRKNRKNNKKMIFRISRILTKNRKIQKKMG